MTGISLLAAQLTHQPQLVSLFSGFVQFAVYLAGLPANGARLCRAGAGGHSGLALVLVFVPFPVITQDKMLIAVFGGFFLGAGIGLAMRGGGVLDGTEIWPCT